MHSLRGWLLKLAPSPALPRAVRKGGSFSFLPPRSAQVRELSFPSPAQCASEGALVSFLRAVRKGGSFSFLPPRAGEG